MSPYRGNLISEFRKYRCRPTQISRISFAVPLLSKGRFAIVTDVGRDAMDADRAADERHERRTAKPCGPDAPTLVSSLR